MAIIPASNPIRFDPPTFQLPPQIIDHYITPPHYDLKFHCIGGSTLNVSEAVTRALREATDLSSG